MLCLSLAHIWNLPFTLLSPNIIPPQALRNSQQAETISNLFQPVLSLKQSTYNSWQEISYVIKLASLSLTLRFDKNNSAALMEYWPTPFILGSKSNSSTNTISSVDMKNPQANIQIATLFLLLVLLFKFSFKKECNINLKFLQ